jgi:hypothetical protein
MCRRAYESMVAVSNRRIVTRRRMTIVTWRRVLGRVRHRPHRATSSRLSMRVVVVDHRCHVNHLAGTIIEPSTRAHPGSYRCRRSDVPPRGMSRVRFPHGACCRTKSRPGAARRAIAAGGAVRSGAYANGCGRLRRTAGASRLASRDADAGHWESGSLRTAAVIPT